MQYVLVEIGLRSRCDGSQHQGKDDISRKAVVFVNGLGICLAAVQRWHKILCEANQRLYEEEYIGDKSEDGVWRDEVVAVMGELVIFNDNKRCDERVEGREVQ